MFRLERNPNTKRVCDSGNRGQRGGPTLGVIRAQRRHTFFFIHPPGLGVGADIEKTCVIDEGIIEEESCCRSPV